MRLDLPGTELPIGRASKCQDELVVIVWRRRDRRLRRLLVGGGDCSRLDCSRARLVAMNLRGALLAGVNFEWADLTESDLRGADLRGANLHGAYLTGARLNGATLTGADLRDTYLLMTDFGDATLTDAQTSGAVWDQATTWPAGASRKWFAASFPIRHGSWRLPAGQYVAVIRFSSDAEVREGVTLAA
jgi:Pentapeptide repeats (8 copies)